MADEDSGETGRHATAEREIPQAVRAELVALGEEDQAVRADLSPEQFQDSVFAGRMLREDSLRTTRLQAIVAAHGWPDSTRAGREAARAAFLVLQHSPVLEFQEEMLPRLEALARAGRMPGSDVAMLVDRVLMYRGLPQRYGTQFTLVDGRWVLHQVEDEDGLEGRRRAVGLPTMEAYVQMMEEHTGIPVQRERQGDH